MSSIGNWQGIGTGGGSGQYCFEGVFDGNNFEIQNLTANNSTSEGFGLFSYIRNATIKNLTIRRANIVSTKKIGILVGMSFGNIDIENITIDEYSSISGSTTIGGVIGNIALSNSGDDHKKAMCTSVVIEHLINKGSVTCTASSQSATQRVGGIIGNIQKIDDSPTSLLTIELESLVNEGKVDCDYSGGIIGGVQSSLDLSRASYEDNLQRRVLKLTECTNKYSGVMGEMIGYLDGAAKYIEFNKCKMSSSNNYVTEWDGKLIYCRTENNSYTVNLFYIKTETTNKTYLIAMNKQSGTTYYNSITSTLSTSQEQFGLFANNHLNVANYNTTNSSFNNYHGSISVIDDVEGLFVEHEEGGYSNDLCYVPYVVIEVVSSNN